jgi:hypothetical protein
VDDHVIVCVDTEDAHLE